MKAIVVGFLVLAGFMGLAMPRQVTAHPPISAADRDQILQATLRLEVEAANASGVILVEYGLATLGQLNGEVVIVTHNHWGLVLDQQARVEIYTSAYQHLTTITGQQVVERTRFVDPGTRIFRAPDEVVRQAPPNLCDLQLKPHTAQVRANAVVYAAHRLADEQRTIVLVPLEIEKIADNQHTAAIRLHNLNAQFIRHGDSGGGIWSSGVLIGNMWTTEKIVNENDTHQVSFAALIPAQLP